MYKKCHNQSDNLLKYFKNCDFVNISNDNFQKKIIDKIAPSFPYDCECRCGASKLVLIPFDTPFVIKIPFTGYHLGFYEDFVNANYDKRFFYDYCLTEVLTYKAAKKIKLDNFFAKERIIGNINSTNIYIQEKIEPYSIVFGKSSTPIKTTPEDLNNFDNLLYEFDGISMDIPEDWLLSAMLYHGKAKTSRFIDFIQENRINDLHEENVGFIEDKPVIFDYSGYYE